MVQLNALRRNEPRGFFLKNHVVSVAIGNRYSSRLMVYPYGRGVAGLDAGDALLDRAQRQHRGNQDDQQDPGGAQRCARPVGDHADPGYPASGLGAARHSAMNAELRRLRPLTGVRGLILQHQPFA